jgi:hypothetical protein
MPDSPPGLRVRIIHYEIIPVAEVSRHGISRESVDQIVDEPGEIAMLRCVAKGKQLTVVCSEERMRELLINGKAKDPQGMIITKREFPLAWEGWGTNQRRTVPSAPQTRLSADTDRSRNG